MKSPRAALAFAVLASLGWAAIMATGRARGDLYTVPGAYASLVVVACFALDPRGLKEALRPRPGPIALGLALGAVVAAATLVAYPLLADLWPPLRADVRALYEAARLKPWQAPLLLAVIAAEEVLWRGLLLDALRGRVPWPAALVGSTLLYAAAQLGTGALAAAGLALLLGSLWALQRRLTGSLASPLATHAVWTTAVVAVFPLEHVR